MNVLITFGGAQFDEATRAIVERGPKLGADRVIVYDDRWLVDQAFYRQNAWLWQHHHKRGFGWYAWKPYVIWQTLQTIHDGDVVMFLDADTEPIAPFGMLFERCRADGGIMLFASENHRQYEWCKRDCYLAMGQEIDRSAPAGVARFALFQKGPWKATQFLMEWITYCVNPTATTFDPSWIANEVPGFVEHRTEQAIMTNLAHKYGLKLYREACAAGDGTLRDRDLYGQLFRQLELNPTKVTEEVLGSAYRNVDSDDQRRQIDSADAQELAGWLRHA